MASTYLIQALTTTCFVHDNLNDLSTRITSPNSPNICAWLPTLRALPPKNVDSVLTRAYSAITKACTNAKAKGTPTSIFQLRIYALKCLIQASPGTVRPDSFWDQLIRFVASFSKTCTDAKQQESGATLVLRAFEDIVQLAEVRPDAGEFLDGPKFMSFCDVWISFAKRVCASSLSEFRADIPRRVGMFLPWIGLEA